MGDGGAARIYVALCALSVGVAWGPSPTVGALTGLAACLLLRSRRRATGTIAGITAVFACGAVVASARTSPSAIETMSTSIPSCRIAGRVTESAGALGTLVSADSAVCEGFAPAERAGVIVVEADLDAGAVASVSGWLLPLGTEGFDAACRRVGAGARVDAVEISVLREPRGAFAMAGRLRDGLERATEHMDVDQGALLRGLSIGDTEGLAATTEEAMRRSGLTHLVAVSGENVALVLGAVALVAARLGLRARVVVCGLALGLYVLVVGPEPSVLRAAAMGAIGLAALANGTRADPLRALGAALVIVIAARPSLAGAAGLHLSAAATAGLVLFGRRIAEPLRRLPRPVALGLGATLAAQIAVAPLLIALFGRLSLVAPLANLLAMPAVAPATILGLLAGAVGTLNAPAGQLVARVASPFVAWILMVGRVTGAPSWAYPEVPGALAWIIAVPLGVAAVLAVRRD